MSKYWSSAFTIAHFNYLKLIVALSIPAGIAWLFFYSQHQANIEVRKYKEEQKLNPTTDRVVVKNYALKEVDDQNRIRWQLIAASGSLAPNNQDVALVDVEVQYYDGPILKLVLKAPLGEANQTTRNVKLMSKDNKLVLAEGDGGKSKFQAKTIALTKKNHFLASGSVLIEWIGKARVVGDLASGEISQSGPKNFRIIGNTHTQILMN